MEDRSQQKEGECGVMEECPEGQRPLRMGTKAGPSFETIVAASRRLPLSPRSTFVGSKPSSPKFVGLRRLGIPSPIGTGKEESSAEIATYSNPKKGSPRRSFRNFHHTIDTGFANVRGAEINNNSPVAGSGDSSQRDTRSDPPSRPQLSVTDQRFSAMVKTASPAAAFSAAKGSKLQIKKTDAHRNRTDSADSASVRSFTVNTEAEGKKNLSETEINRLVRSSIEKARRNAKMSKAAAKEAVSYKTVSQTILASTVSTRSTIQEDGNGKSTSSKLDAKEGRQDDAVESQRDEAIIQVRNCAPFTSTDVAEKARLESLEPLDSARKAIPSPRSPAKESLRHFFSAGEGEAKQRTESNFGDCASESRSQKAAGSTGSEPHGCQSPTSPITGRLPTSPASVHSIRSGSSTLSERVQVSLERAKMARDEIAELLHEGPAVSNSRSRVDLIVAETMRRAKEAADNDNASGSVIALNSVSTKREIEPRVFPEEPTSPCSVNNGARVDRVDTAVYSPRSTNTTKSEPAVPSASDIFQVVEVESPTSQKTATIKCVSSLSEKSLKDPTYDDTSQHGPTSLSPQNQSLKQEFPLGIVVSSNLATQEEASACELKPTVELLSTITPEAKLGGVASTPKSDEAPVLQVAACMDTRTKPETRLKSEASTYKDLIMSMSAELKESLAAARPKEDTSTSSSCTSSDLASENQGPKSVNGQIGIGFGATSVLSETVEQEELYVVDDEKKTKILQSTLSLCDAPDRGLEVALIPQSKSSCSDETIVADESSKASINSSQEGGEFFEERAESPASTRSDFVSAVQNHPESGLRAVHSAHPNKESHSSFDENALSKGVFSGVGETFQSPSSAIKCLDQAKTTPNNNSSEEMKSLHPEVDNHETIIVEAMISADDEFLGTTILSPVMPSDASELSGRSGKYSRSIHPRRQASRKRGKQRLARSPSNGSQDTITVTEEFLAEMASRKGATMTTDELNQLLRATINPKMPPSKIETIKSSGSEESVLESNEQDAEGFCQSGDRVRNPTLYSSRSSQESRVSQHSRNTNGSRSTQESRLSAMQQSDGRFCVDFIDMLRQLGFRDVAEDHLTINEDSLANNSLSGSYSDDFISDDETNNESEIAGDEVSLVKDEDAVIHSKYDGSGKDDESTIADHKTSIVRSEEETFDHETTESVSYGSGDGETHESFTQQDCRRVTFSFSDGQFTLDDFASTSSEEEETESSVRAW